MFSSKHSHRPAEASDCSDFDPSVNRVFPDEHFQHPLGRLIDFVPLDPLPGTSRTFVQSFSRRSETNPFKLGRYKILVEATKVADSDMVGILWNGVTLSTGNVQNSEACPTCWTRMQYCLNARSSSGSLH